MSWERALLDLFDDLETQAVGLSHAARDEDVADLARAEYAELGLEQRLHGSVGHEVGLEASGGAVLRGVLERVGRGCLAVRSSQAPRVLHLVNLDHVTGLSTPSGRAEAEASLPVTSRLGLASAVRHLAEDADEVALRLADGRRVSGLLVRVGADFVELVAAEGDGAGVLVPLRALVTIAPA